MKRLHPIWKSLFVLMFAIALTQCEKDDVGDSLDDENNPNLNSAEILCSCEENEICEVTSRTGTFLEGTEFSTHATVGFKIDVTKIGDYNVKTDEKNGYYLQGSGTISELGEQYIDLSAIGTPTIGQKDTFNIKIGANTCRLVVNVYKPQFLGEENRIIIVSGRKGFMDEVPYTFALDGFGKQIWSISGSNYEVAIRNDTLYLLGSNGLFARNINTGEEIWSNKNFTSGTITLGSNQLIVNYNEITTIDLGTGSSIWNFNASSGFSETVFGNNLLFGGADKFYALNHDGTVNWSKEININCSPVVDDNYVYLTTEDSLYSLSQDNGDINWKVAGQFNYTSPTISDGKIVLSGEQVHCYDKISGNLLWQTNITTHETISEPAIHNGTVYVIANFVKAIELQSGNELWSVAEDWATEYAPVVYGDLIINAAPGGFDARKASSGSSVWNFGKAYDLQNHISPTMAPVIYDTELGIATYYSKHGNQQ